MKTKFIKLLCFSLFYLSHTCTAIEIRVGFTDDFSEAYKSHAENYVRGLHTAFNSINELGGINGNTFKLIVIESTSDPKVLKSTLRQLDAMDVKFIIYNPRMLVDEQDILENFLAQNNIYVMSANLNIDSPYKHIFYKTGIQAQLIELLNLFNKRKHSLEQTLFITDLHATGQECAVQLRAIWKKNNYPNKLNLIKDYDKSKDKNKRALIDKINKLNVKPRSIITCINGEDLAEIAPDLIAANQDASLATLGSYINDPMLQNNKFTSMNNLIVTRSTPFYNLNIPAAINYKQKFNDYYPEIDYDSISFEGYITAHIIMEIIKISGSIIDIDGAMKKIYNINGLNLGLDMPIAPSNDSIITRVWLEKLLNNSFVNSTF